MRQSLKKGVKWEWTEERNADFNNLKKELTTQPCLPSTLQRQQKYFHNRRM